MFATKIHAGKKKKKWESNPGPSASFLPELSLLILANSGHTNTLTEVSKHNIFHRIHFFFLPRNGIPSCGHGGLNGFDLGLCSVGPRIQSVYLSLELGNLGFLKQEAKVPK
jgi:hypothetical protein